MMDESQSKEQEFTIDIMSVLKVFIKRIKLIIAVAVLSAGIGFSLAAFVIPPKYSASIRLYVNIIKSDTAENTEISESQINTAKTLVKTYMEILDSRPTYDQVLALSGTPYTPKRLSEMITAGASNETEVMYVTVTANDPYEAATIANCIAQVLPERIAQVIDGASVQIIESAIPSLDRVSPGIAKYTLIGLFLGVFAVCGYIALQVILDNTVHDEDYIIQSYHYPILAKIPDLFEPPHANGYGYYKKNQRGAK